MSTFRLDRSAFKAQTAEEAANHASYYAKLTWQERLAIPGESLLFRDLENVWDEMKFVYSGDFRTLVYGDLPEEEAVFETLKMIRERLTKVSWSIKP